MTVLLTFLFAGKSIFSLDYDDDAPFYIKTDAGMVPNA